jgi:hypothetical protein
MNFRLLDSGWGKAIDEAVVVDASSIRIVCPFIKSRTIERILKHGNPKSLQIITRFNLNDFIAGVSDVSALRFFLDKGAQIRGIRNLHAKMYLFGSKRVIVTSANLTDAALLRNHEFGFVADEPDIVTHCREYFDRLWVQAAPNLSVTRLEDWEHRVAQCLLEGARPTIRSGLTDEGINIGIPTSMEASPEWVSTAKQSFVKFFGRSSDDRVPRFLEVFAEVSRSGCHWACAYPKNKRPRVVKDGALMFMGRLVEKPDDILIYGRAVAMQYEHGRDDATLDDLRLRPWKKDFPHYARVHHAEFVGGTLANGVSFYQLLDELKADAVASTQRNLQRGEGNTDPRWAYRRQAAVELSVSGCAWLNHHLERAFAQHSRLAPALLNQLDWPTIPLQASGPFTIVQISRS